MCRSRSRCRPNPSPSTRPQRSSSASSPKDISRALRLASSPSLSIPARPLRPAFSRRGPCVPFPKLFSRMDDMRHFISPWTLAALGAFGSAAVDAQTEHAHAQIETVVVTGHESGLAAELARVSRIPGGASVVDLDAIGGRTPSNRADALRYVPGVWSASHAGNDGIFFSSRGSNLDATDWDMNGIKLLQDGLPVTTADGNNHNRVVDPLAAHYMTVARGANALEYGASTLGGAIDLVTPTGRDHPGVDVAANAGSHGFALGRFSYGVDVGDRFDAFVTIEAKTNDG